MFSTGPGTVLVVAVTVIMAARVAEPVGSFVLLTPFSSLSTHWLPCLLWVPALSWL